MKSRLQSPKVVIDGFEFPGVYELRLEHGTYDDAFSFDSGYMHREKLSSVQATLVSMSGMQLEFRVEGHEQIGDTLHFYGPLRNAFPDMFKDIDPLPWQVAYLKFIGRPSLDRFKVRRTSEIFLEPNALIFEAGYTAGDKVTSAVKVEKITADKAMSNLTQAMQNTVKATDDFSGILGSAFRKKVG